MLQSQAGTELRARTIRNLKEVSRQHQEIERRVELLKVFLENESQRCNEKADFLDNLDSSPEK